jgi:hypothetical protein
MMNRKSLLSVLLLPLIPLLIPLVGTLTSEQWQWHVRTFVAAWVIMTGFGFAYKFVTRKAGSVTYRVATGLALVAAFVLLWRTAVRTSEIENPANLLCAVTLVIGAVGSLLAHFKPFGMARTLAVAATVQFFIPAILILFWPRDFRPVVIGDVGANCGFVLMFAASAFLFRRASRTPTTDARMAA